MGPAASVVDDASGGWGHRGVAVPIEAGGRTHRRVVGRASAGGQGARGRGHPVALHRRGPDRSGHASRTASLRRPATPRSPDRATRSSRRCSTPSRMTCGPPSLRSAPPQAPCSTPGSSSPMRNGSRVPRPSTGRPRTCARLRHQPAGPEPDRGWGTGHGPGDLRGGRPHRTGRWNGCCPGSRDGRWRSQCPRTCHPRASMRCCSTRS